MRQHKAQTNDSSKSPVDPTWLTTGLWFLLALGLGTAGALSLTTSIWLATGEIIAGFIIPAAILTRSRRSLATKSVGCCIAASGALVCVVGAHSHVLESRRTMVLSVGPVFTSGGGTPVFFAVNRYAQELYPVPLLATVIVKNISPIPVWVDKATARICIDGRWYDMPPVPASEIVRGADLSKAVPMPLSNPFWEYQAQNPIDPKRERRGVLAFEFPDGVAPSQIRKEPPIEITMFDDSGESASINLNDGSATVEKALGKGLYVRFEPPEDLSKFSIMAFRQR